MPTQGTSWARESARLAFFAVSMGERKDASLLGLFEQANNALESYLTARQVSPPTLVPMAAPTPKAPSRPLSILSSPTAPPLSKPPPPPVAPLNVRPAEPDWQPSIEVCKQFCVAFAAIEAHLPQDDYSRYLAMYDVCAGRGLAEAARDRRVDVSPLRRELLRMKAVGPKVYLDQALDRPQPSSQGGQAL